MDKSKNVKNNDNLSTIDKIKDIEKKPIETPANQLDNKNFKFKNNVSNDKKIDNIINSEPKKFKLNSGAKQLEKTVINNEINSLNPNKNEPVNKDNINIKNENNNVKSSKINSSSDIKKNILTLNIDDNKSASKANDNEDEDVIVLIKKINVSNENDNNAKANNDNNKSIVSNENSSKLDAKNDNNAKANNDNNKSIVSNENSSKLDTKNDNNSPSNNNKFKFISNINSQEVSKNNNSKIDNISNKVLDSQNDSKQITKFKFKKVSKEEKQLNKINSTSDFENDLENVDLRDKNLDSGNNVKLKNDDNDKNNKSFKFKPMSYSIPSPNDDILYLEKTHDL
jgi:hypothetical protein